MSSIEDIIMEATNEIAEKFGIEGANNIVFGSNRATDDIKGIIRVIQDYLDKNIKIGLTKSSIEDLIATLALRALLDQRRQELIEAKIAWYKKASEKYKNENDWPRQFACDIAAAALEAVWPKGHSKESVRPPNNRIIIESLECLQNQVEELSKNQE